MMVETTEYKMGQGEYIEDRNLEELAKKHLEGVPLIIDYEYGIIDNGTRKNTLEFGVEFVDPRDGLEEFSAEDYDDALLKVNEFLEEATGRRAELRKKDMKKN